MCIIKNVIGLEKLDVLKLNLDQYIIGGSAACIVLGLKICNNDLDIAIDRKNPDVLEKIKNTDKILDFGLDQNYPLMDFDEYMKYTHVVEGYRFLNKEGLIKLYMVLYEKYPKEKYLMRLEWLSSIE